MYIKLDQIELEVGITYRPFILFIRFLVDQKVFAIQDEQ